MVADTDNSLEEALIKVRVTIGPISLDVEDRADKLTMLVTKIVESFIFKRIIGVTAGPEALTELQNQVKI